MKTSIIGIREYISHLACLCRVYESPVLHRNDYLPQMDPACYVLLRCWDSSLSAHSRRHCLASWCEIRTTWLELRHGQLHDPSVMPYVENPTSLRRLVDSLVSALGDPRIPDTSCYDQHLMCLFRDVSDSAHMSPYVRAAIECRIGDLVMNASTMASKILCSKLNEDLMVSVIGLVDCIKWVKPLLNAFF